MDRIDFERMLDLKVTAYDLRGEVTYDDLLNFAEYLVQFVHAERAAHRWIPVSERLPEVGEEVITYTEQGVWTTTYAEHWAWCMYLPTHWMPLPPLPKEMK